MERSGSVRDWRHDKGFGFIQPAAGGRDLFVHVSAVAGGQALCVGERVRYRLGRDERGRPCALHVRPVTGLGASRATRGRVRHLALKLAGLGMLLVLPLWGCAAVLASRQSLLPLTAYLAASLAAFLLYWQDKRRAVRQRWRTPESLLQLVALSGGWPGALVAQQLLRHKTRKVPFLLILWASVALHQAFWIDYLFLRHLAQAFGALGF